MKIPLWCPNCRDEVLEFAYVDHQHLICSNCRAHWCWQCPGAAAGSITEYRRRARRAAALN